MWAAHPAFEAALRSIEGVSYGDISTGYPMESFTVFHGPKTTCCLFKEAVAHAVTAVKEDLKTRVADCGPTTIGDVEIARLQESSPIQGFAVLYHYAYKEPA
jgi:hypothetical protein